MAISRIINEVDWRDKATEQLRKGSQPSTKVILNGLCANDDTYSIGTDGYLELFDYMCKLGNQEILDELLVYGAIRWRHHSSRTALSNFRRLLDAGARVSHVDREWGKTPLHFQAVKADLEVVHLLLERGANVNARDKQLNTPLHDICAMHSRHGNTKEVMEVLLVNGADVSAKNDAGMTALEHLLEYVDTIPGDLVKLLLDQGADIAPALDQLVAVRNDTHWSEQKTVLIDPLGILSREPRTVRAIYYDVFGHCWGPPPVDTHHKSENAGCMICLESAFRCGDAALTLGCGHTLCARCAYTLDATNCPKCRQRVKWGLRLFSE